MSTWQVTGSALVTVVINVEAETEAEARSKAMGAERHEWECDEVDGEVTGIGEAFEVGE